MEGVEGPGGSEAELPSQPHGAVVHGAGLPGTTVMQPAAALAGSTAQGGGEAPQPNAGQPPSIGATGLEIPHAAHAARAPHTRTECSAGAVPPGPMHTGGKPGGDSLASLHAHLHGLLTTATNLSANIHAYPIHDEGHEAVSSHQICFASAVRHFRHVMFPWQAVVQASFVWLLLLSDNFAFPSHTSCANQSAWFFGKMM